MKIRVAPSILSADFSNLGAEVIKVEKSGADLIHCDVMDGSFVEPITFGAQMVKSIRPHTMLPLAVHLMIEHPKTQIKFFADAGADIITVHYGACKKISDSYLKEALELIRSYGVRCGAAVNPDEDVENLFPIFPLCDLILLMTVFPGYGGQKYIKSVTPKIAKARKYADSIGLKELNIEVDGGITEKNFKTAKSAGANYLVAGSAIFNSKDMIMTMENFRNK